MPLKILQYFAVITFIISIFFFYYCTRTLSFFPTDEGITYKTLKDTGSYDPENPVSVTEISDLAVNKDSSVSFSFKIGDKNKYPYVGVMIHHDSMKSFDISSYYAIKCVFDLTNVSKFLLVVNASVKEINGKETNLLRNHNTEVFIPSKNRTTITPLKNLYVPDYWYRNRNLMPSQFVDKPDWKNMKTINIENSESHKRNVKYDIIVKDISLIRSMVPFYISLSIWIISLIIIWYLVYKKRSVSGSNERIEYSTLNVDDNSTEEYNRIVNYLNNRFTESELAIAQVSKDIGVSQRKISSLLKENNKGTFKTYLNDIRLNEAKRLIITSDKKVSEISFLVGYNYQSHFTSLFSKKFKKTPSQMRNE